VPKTSGQVSAICAGTVIAVTMKVMRGLPVAIQ
jgi:hypothetical protein